MVITYKHFSDIFLKRNKKRERHQKINPLKEIDPMLEKKKVFETFFR